MTKRLIAFLLTLVITVSCLPLGIFAADQSDSEDTPATAMIYVESTYCVIGKEVEVDICVANNPGIAGAKFSVSFDEALTLVGASEEGGVFEALDYTAPNTLGNLCPFNWDSLDAVATEDGRIITLTFAVADTVTAGEQLDINVSYNYGDIYDVELDSIAVTMVGGSLDVIDYLPGDVDGDGVVNGKDVTLIRRYNAGWEVEINLLAADANGDGVINGKDVTQLRRYNAGWEVPLVPGFVVCTHSLTAVEAKEPTCTEAGNTAYWQCSLCEIYFADAEAENEISLLETVIEATGHSYGDWATTKDATCTEEGIKERACSTCASIDTDMIEKNPNNHPTDALEVIPGYDASFENEGLTDGKTCTACGNIVQEQVSIPAGKENAVKVVYWYNYDNKKEEFILTKGASEYVIEPEIRVGYEHLGWFKEGATEPTTVIITTQVDETGVLNLYAKWNLKTYDIFYHHAPENSNPTTYTIEDEIVFTDPLWSGLSFAYWTDAEGNQITKIERGSVGNVILTANWISERNMAVPTATKTVKAIVFDDVLNRYYFIYDLGTIENIELTTLGTDDKSAGEEIKWILSETVSVEDTIADTVARTVTNSISKTSGWEESRNWVTSKSASISSSISAGIEVEECGVKAKIEAAISGTISSEESQSRGYGTSGSTTNGSETSNSVSSTVSYTKGLSTTIAKEITISGEMPKGKYSYVYAGTTHVYAIVTYDPNEKSYYLDTYSILDDKTYEKRLYDAPADTTANITYSDGLDFDIPEEEIETYVESLLFTIGYELNGGEFLENQKYPTVYAVGEEIVVPNAKYSVYPNHIEFLGWYEDEECTVLFENGLRNQSGNITLYAKWKPFAQYDSMASIPTALTDEYVLIDLSKEDNLNFSNTIVISNTVKEVVFIGDSSKIFTNLNIQLSQFEEGKQPIISFDNFKFITNSSAAITLVECEDINLVIEVVGESSIATYKSGGNIIDIGTSNLEIKGDGLLVVTAGNGATGTTGAIGGTGGTGIIANTVTVTGHVSCTIVGGTGGMGGTGANGNNASGTYYYAGYYVYNSDWDGDTAHAGYEYRGYAGGVGGRGGDGGVGGMAVNASAFSVYTDGTICIIAGNGGHGGVGGTGGRGADGATGNGAAENRTDIQNGGAGGNGGQGGSGGNGGYASFAISCTPQIYNDAAEITITEGIRGNGGHGGRGGTGGNGGDGGTHSGTQGTLNLGWGEKSATANGGNRGYGGAGGAGGNGYTNGSTGSTGDNGIPGSRGVNYWTKSNGEIKYTYYGLNGQ